MSVRTTVDGVIDRIRFEMDRRPSTYHPMPWAGTQVGLRADGTETRWAEIEATIRGIGPATALDIGCNTGYFTLRLAEQGMEVVGIEHAERPLRILSYLNHRAGRDNVGIYRLRLSPRTIELLPSADAVLFLSVWHHYVKWYGQGAADDAMKRIWDRTRRILFFDSGEEEVADKYHLPPLVPSAREWFTAYLASCCEGGDVRHLGMHEHIGLRRSPRSLFAVVRSQV